MKSKEEIRGETERKRGGDGTQRKGHRLASSRVNTGERGDRASVGKPGYIPDSRHELGTQRIPHVVKPVLRNFLEISLVGLDLAQRVVPVVLDKLRVHRTDVQPRVMEKLDGVSTCISRTLRMRGWLPCLFP